MNFKKVNKIKSLLKYQKSKTEFSYFMKISGKLYHGKEIRSRAFGNFVYDCTFGTKNAGDFFNPEIDIIDWGN